MALGMHSPPRASFASASKLVFLLLTGCPRSIQANLAIEGLVKGHTAMASDLARKVFLLNILILIPKTVSKHAQRGITHLVVEISSIFKPRQYNCFANVMP